MNLASLAARQEALVAALVAGAPLPDGFDPRTVGIAADALRRKRAGEVARAWPLLAAALGTRWRDDFAAWAKTRPPRGSFLDGWDFARSLAASGDLPLTAIFELARVEARWRQDALGARRRRQPAIRTVPGGAVLQVLGRVYTVGPPVRRRRTGYPLSG
jgi:hypothetical protein